MLKKVKILLGFELDDTQDDLLALLIEMAQGEVIALCNLKEYTKELDNVVLKMVVQNFNKLGQEGMNSSSFSGVIAENYLTNYSDEVLAEIKKHRKIRTI